MDEVVPHSEELANQAKQEKTCLETNTYRDNIAHGGHTGADD